MSDSVGSETTGSETTGSESVRLDGSVFFSVSHETVGLVPQNPQQASLGAVTEQDFAF